MVLGVASKASPAQGVILYRGDGTGVPYVKASLTSGTGNSQIQFTAYKPGANGNNITVTIVESGNDTPLSVSAAGNDITINLATDGVGSATSLVRDVIAAINDSDAVSQLVNADGGSGLETGIVAAAAQANLTGGQDSTETFDAISEVRGFTGPGGTSDEVEVTHLLSPGRRKEFKPTLIDGGEVSFDMNTVLSDDAQKNFLRDQDLQRTRNWQIRLTDLERTLLFFQGYVKNNSFSANTGEVVQTASAVRVTGEILIIA